MIQYLTEQVFTTLNVLYTYMFMYKYMYYSCGENDEVLRINIKKQKGRIHGKLLHPIFTACVLTCTQKEIMAEFFKDLIL